MIVAQADREFMGSPLREQPDKPFYHYTGPGGLEGILGKGAIWATDYRGLNDDEELTRGENAITGELDAIIGEHDDNTPLGDLARRVRGLRDGHRVIDIPNIGIYVTSFSTEPELSHQWDHYADHGKGYAIGFKSLPLPTGNPTPQRLELGLSVDFGYCLYDEAQYRKLVREIILFVASGLEKYCEYYAKNEAQVESLVRTARICALARLGASVWFLKRPSFEGESELRLVQIGAPPEQPQERQVDGRAVKFIEIDIRKDGCLDLYEIMAGPAEPSAKPDGYLKSVMDRSGYEHVKLSRSRLTYP